VLSHISVLKITNKPSIANAQKLFLTFKGCFSQFGILVLLSWDSTILPTGVWVGNIVTPNFWRVLHVRWVILFAASRMVDYLTHDSKFKNIRALPG
jgi:hypothetical protein